MAPASPSAASPGAMGNPEWPPSLKAMVATAFAQVGARADIHGDQGAARIRSRLMWLSSQCDDPSQKAAVQAELKTVSSGATSLGPMPAHA